MKFSIEIQYPTIKSCKMEYLDEFNLSAVITEIKNAAFPVLHIFAGSDYEIRI